LDAITLHWATDLPRPSTSKRPVYNVYMQYFGVTPRSERTYPDRVIGARILDYDVVDSTMDEARAAAVGGAPHGTVCRSVAQRVGRGRFSRRWESNPGDSLLLSVVLRMPPLPINAAVSVAGSLAVRNSVAETLGVECSIKWPNDVLVASKKIAGVLVESQITVDGRGFAILGIGLNVNLTPESFEGIAGTATSMSTVLGGSVAMDCVEETLIRNIDSVVAELVEGNKQTIDQWRTHLTMLGKEVIIHTREGAIQGQAMDVDEEGALLLQVQGGAIHRMMEGDVTLQN
jgi:BirA family biotin operon repressor/biotin-[acetyl-CoA-carboxylase] ligase